MIDAPPSIRRFEALWIASLVIGLVHSFAWEDGGVVEATAVAAVLIALTLQISRRRKNWARWLLTAMFLAGAAMMLATADLILDFGHLSSAIVAAISLMQTVGVALLLTPEAGKWLHPASEPA